MNAKDRQVGGDHYKKMAIQPIDFIRANELNFVQGNLVKYACRYPSKGTPIIDLQKIIQYCELEIDALRSEGIE